MTLTAIVLGAMLALSAASLDPRVGREGDIAPLSAVYDETAPPGHSAHIESRTGWATYCAPTATHCQSWGGDTFVGAVRSFIYGDDPYWLQVCRADRPSTCTHVLIVSYCACGQRRGEPTLVDLSPAAFRELAPLSVGLIRVQVDRGARPRVTLPPTDTE